MKVGILGGDKNILCQIPAIREAFSKLGHINIMDLSDPDLAFIFVGNPPFDDYIDLSETRKTIFNILDIPFHLKEVDEIINKLRYQLPKASRITTISKTVQKHLFEKCGVNSEVIHYPMKPVRHTGKKEYSQFKVALVGRLGDPNKRAALAVHALIRAGYEEREIATIGPEYLGYGTRLGTVSNEALNDIYNSVDYVMMMSKNEGIGLPAIEGACCGAIPIVMPDLSTFDEFWADSPLGLNYQTLTSVNKIAELINSLDNNQEWKNEVKQDILAYSELAFRPKFDRMAVVKRILDVYLSI